MRPVEARYDQGTLKLAHPLPLLPGERVRVIVVRTPDPKRWSFSRLRAADTSKDDALSEAGLAAWDRALDGAVVPQGNTARGRLAPLGGAGSG